MSPETIKTIQQQSALLAETSLSSRMNPCVINRVVENSAGRTLPNLMRVKTAFELGRETRNGAMCERVYRCGKELNIPTEAEVMARAAVPDCDALDGVCPGLNIGCGP